MKSGKALLGVLIGVTTGAVVGAALGLIYAPRKGTETRKKISKKGSEYTNAVVNKFEDIVDVFTKKFEMIERELPKLTGGGKQNGESTVEKIPPLVNK